MTVIKRGPKWKPATQNGKTVNSYHTIPFTISIGNDTSESSGTPKSDPLFEKGETWPTVDGEEWKKFITTNFKPIVEEAQAKGAKPGHHYTVRIRFIIEKDGSINSLEVIKDPGYDLGQKVIAMMNNSPRWNPAKVKNKPVRSYYTIPITFLIPKN